MARRIIMRLYNTMSGHSKWATTKRAKAAVDAKRGAMFTKIANLITIAARERGGDPDTNFTLRMAMEKAKQANMPKDNIARAIKRGTGEGGGQEVAELLYEGFGPAKSQFIVKCLTDNRNRAGASIRHLFAKYGGSLGAVAWNFEKKGVIRVLKEELKNANIKLDDLELNLIDAGAQDFLPEEEGVTIYAKIEDLQALKKFVEEKNLKTETADIEFIAKENQKIEGEDKKKIEKFIEELENCEDVADYYTNAIY